MKIAYAEVVENSRLYGDAWLTWRRSAELGNGAYRPPFMLRCSDDEFYGRPPSATSGDENSVKT